MRWIVKNHDWSVSVGKNPLWNEKGTILISDISSDVIKFKIMNENFIGRCGRLVIEAQ